MAKKKKKAKAPVALTERNSPLLGNALLWLGFLVVLVVGVVTVFVPELSDDSTEEEGAAADDARDDESDTPERGSDEAGASSP